jgi:hypothetical protein
MIVFPSSLQIVDHRAAELFLDALGARLGLSLQSVGLHFFALGVLPCRFGRLLGLDGALGVEPRVELGFAGELGGLL